MSREIIGDIEIAEVPGSDPILDSMGRARQVFKKGRMEWMGGPVYFEQDGANNNVRDCKYTYPMGLMVDPESHKFMVDTTEQ